jgi:hypothetical protein
MAPPFPKKGDDPEGSPVPGAVTKLFPWEPGGGRWTLNQPASGHLRIACSEPCEVGVAERNAGIVWNLSTVGLYVVLESMPGMGDLLHLSFALPGEETPIHCEAKVVWQNPPSIFKGCGAKAAGLPPGCGLAFVTLGDEDRARIEVRVKSTALSVG